MEPQQKHRPRGGWWLIVLPLAAVIVVIPVVVAGVWWMKRGSQPRDVVQSPLPPEAAQPTSPPPPWKGELALTAAGASVDNSAIARNEPIVKGMPGVVSLDTSDLEKIPLDRVAPASLLALPDDARAVEAISRIPRHERWEIQFPPGNTIDSYSRQLDFFKIELGVIGESDKVVFLTNLSAPTPMARSEAAASDQRLYLIWQRGALREAAEELVSRAKVDPRGKVLAHFCPAELETKLADLEDEFARQKTHRQVRKTIFGIKPNESGGYVFFVIDQKADE